MVAVHSPFRLKIHCQTAIHSPTLIDMVRLNLVKKGLHSRDIKEKD